MFLIAIRHEVNNSESSVVVQKLELTINLALFIIFLYTLLTMFPINVSINSSSYNTYNSCYICTPSFYNRYLFFIECMPCWFDSAMQSPAWKERTYIDSLVCCFYCAYSIFLWFAGQVWYSIVLIPNRSFLSTLVGLRPTCI